MDQENNDDKYVSRFMVLLLLVMAVTGVPHAVCCIQVDTADALRHLDNAQCLDTDRQTSRETVAVQPSVM